MILIAGLLSAALWLSVGFERKKYDNYLVYMTEPVSGLSEESLVKYNGVRVGVVDKIELSQFDPQKVKISLKIEEGTPVTTSTHATLIAQGITGNTYLGLSASSPSLFPLQKKPGELYPVIPYTPSFFSQLEKNLNDVSLGVKAILNTENAKSIKKSLANLQKITDVIADNHNGINQSLQDLPKVISELKVGIQKFDTMATVISESGKQFSTTMKTGKNGIDRISQQTLPSLTLLLQRLDSIAANLEKVSADMRQNPAVIIRGTSPPQRGPGE